MSCKHLVNIRICCLLKPTIVFPENLCILQNYALKDNKAYETDRVGSDPSKLVNVSEYNKNPIKNTSIVHLCLYLHLAP